MCGEGGGSKGGDGIDGGSEEKWSPALVTNAYVDGEEQEGRG